MISTKLANNILNAFYGRFGSGGTSLIPTSNACYLGFSNAAPTFSEAGECTGGLPIMVMALTTEVTLGLKNTLILYKGKLTTSLTAADVQS